MTSCVVWMITQSQICGSHIPQDHHPASIWHFKDTRTRCNIFQIEAHGSSWLKWLQFAQFTDIQLVFITSKRKNYNCECYILLFNIHHENKANISQPIISRTIAVAFLCVQIYVPTIIHILLQLVNLLHFKSVVQLKTFKWWCPYTWYIWSTTEINNVCNTIDVKDPCSSLWSWRLTVDSFEAADATGCTERAVWLPIKYLRCQRYPTHCHSRKMQVSQRYHICQPHWNIPKSPEKLKLCQMSALKEPN